MAATGLWNRQLSVGESFAITPRQIVYAVALGAVVLSNADECSCEDVDIWFEPNNGGNVWKTGVVSTASTPNTLEGPTDMPHYFASDPENLLPIVIAE